MMRLGPNPKKILQNSEKQIHIPKGMYRITSNDSRPIITPAPLKFQKKSIKYL